MSEMDRRRFFSELAALTGTIVVAPVAISCGETQKPETQQPETQQPIARVDASDAPSVPVVRPDDWDPIAFNKSRGLKGAIPKSYFPDITGPDGEKKHLGKHLPYIPPIDESNCPEGYIPVMWGNPEKGYTMHPNAAEGSENYPLGHWYDRVKVKKAVKEEVIEAESRFHAWPGSPGETGTVFKVFGGGEITQNSGKNTIYMLKKPDDVKQGDTLRIFGHCLYHGEYVDFIEYTFS